jgi:Cd2+/Zn2+-exporting ATPase
MLTGDTPAAAQPIADALHLDGCHASLLPDGKLELAAALKEQCTDGTLLYIGDGINDAPVLAMADVGIAMGALGSDAAMEAADVVIMDDAPTKAADAIALAKKTMRIARQNIAFALGVKGLILILGAIGITGMWAAVFGDVGVCLLCVLNAARANRK